MRIRQAWKILNNVTGPKEDRWRKSYREGTLIKARAAIDNSPRTKTADKFWSEVMGRLGPIGRAQILARQGHTGNAFGLLMRET